ncbi:hypothetical protein ACFL2Z_01010 [Candidatus Eisenbacteria bacterium]|uniref:Transcriptional regulator n=1 Tax=Eiseniibacteriota bacterium TaxID=2212470 RepID=A0ABV6YN34_UNCEI
MTQMELNGSPQPQRKNRDNEFTKMFNTVIDHIWGLLPPTAQAIYPVLVRFADYHTRCARVSQGRVGRISRRRPPIAQSQVSRTIRRDLVKWGLVQIRKYKDQFGFVQTLYYLPRGSEVLQHIIKNDLMDPDEWDSLERRYEGTSSEEDSDGTVAEESALDEIPETIDELGSQGMGKHGGGV